MRVSGQQESESENMTDTRNSKENKNVWEKEDSRGRKQKVFA